MPRGRVDDLLFFKYLSSFCFLSIEFHRTFSISYKILPYYVYYYILIRMLQAYRPFFPCPRASFHTHASLLTFFVCFFVLFRSCYSHARVLGKTLLLNSPFNMSILNGTCFLSTVQLLVRDVYSERKSRNSCALVSLCL